jgi:hypothetical protein
MAKTIRPKFEMQKDRLRRERDGLAKPHPETLEGEEAGASVEAAQIADVSPSEIVERTAAKEEDATSDPRREANAEKEGGRKPREPGANEDTENRLGKTYGKDRFKAR